MINLRAGYVSIDVFTQRGIEGIRSMITVEYERTNKHKTDVTKILSKRHERVRDKAKWRFITPMFDIFVFLAFICLPIYFIMQNGWETLLQYAYVFLSVVVLDYLLKHYHGVWTYESLALYNIQQHPHQTVTFFNDRVEASDGVSTSIYRYDIIKRYEVVGEYLFLSPTTYYCLYVPVEAMKEKGTIDHYKEEAVLNEKTLGANLS